MSSVRDVAGLEAAVGARPLGSMLKTIHHLDVHCRTIIDRSVAAAVAVAPATGPIDMRLVGGETGFATIDGPSRLGLGTTLRAGSAGLLFFTAGWRETLRVNGRLDDTGSLDVDEAFVHCGKAMIRSQFWAGHDVTPAESVSADRTAELTENQRNFLATTRMAVLGTCDAHGNADVSPKGDHAGFVQVLDATRIAIPNRPGNRRTDSFHNLVERDDIAVLAMTPGDERVLSIQGRARLQTDDHLLDSMAVDGKRPSIALVVDVHRATLAVDDVLAAAGLWNPANHVRADELPKATTVWTDHIKMDETPGDEAQLIRDVITADAMETGIAQDYEQNLY